MKDAQVTHTGLLIAEGVSGDDEVLGSHRLCTPIKGPSRSGGSLFSHEPRDELLIFPLTVGFHALWCWLEVEPDTTVRTILVDGVFAVIAQWLTAHELTGFSAVVCGSLTTAYALEILVLFTQGLTWEGTGTDPGLLELTHRLALS